MLNGIDVASFQQGINLKKIAADFVIVKATQGAKYVNPAMKAQIASAEGKLLGLYHYANGAGIDAEVSNFITAAQPYIGKAILVLDWESAQNAAFGKEAYAKQWLDSVKAKTGVTPLIYISQSVCKSFASTAGVTEYPLWVAQYGSTAKQYGYDQKPWTSGSVKPWTKETIRQYTSTGVLEGWGHLLDLDIAYIDKADWEKLAGKKEEKASTKPTYTVSGYTLHDVTYGDQDECVRFLQQLLTAAGFTCDADGICGDQTLEALAGYQAAQRRTTCGKGTWEVLIKQAMTK